MMIPEIWKMSTAISLAGLVLLVIAWLAVARSNLKADLAQARSEVVLCQSANAEWEAKSASVNAAIGTLHKEAEKRQSQAIDAQKHAAKEAAHHATHAKNILMTSGKGDDCRFAEELIHKYLKNRI